MPRTNQVPYLTPSRRTPGATYHWKPSPRLRRLGWQNLRLGTDWNAAVPAAIAQNDTLDRWLAANASAEAPRAPPRIVRWRDLDASYRASDAWAQLKPRSKREYASHMRTLDQWALDGQLRLCDLDRPMIVDLRDRLVADPRKHRTAAMLRVLCILVAHGVNKGWLPLGLASRIGIPTPPKRKHRLLISHLPWLLEAADALALPHIRLGAVLGFFTMQREGDLLATTEFRFRAIGGDDISGEARRALAGPDGRVLGLFLTQEKTDAPVGIPLLPRARAGVEAAIAASRAAGSTLTHLIVKSARPCHQKTFQRDFARVRAFAAAAARTALSAHLAAREAANDLTAWLDRRDALEALVAALVGCQFRDLRRSGMCWLRELGVPVAMIASISGHSIEETQKILDTYMPRDTRSAAEGMALALTRQAARDAADAAELEEANG
jgi:hypothetical protein